MKLSLRHIIYCFLFWTAVFGLTVAGHYFNAMFRDIPFHWKESIPFAAGWYIWFLLTFPALYIAFRYPLNGKAARRIRIHFIFFLAFNIIQITGASLLTSSLLTWLNNDIYSDIFRKTAISGSFYNLVVYAGLIILVNSLRNYTALQEERTHSLELEKQLVTGRINYLKQQLQPHFLFNTHHSIITLMKLGEIQSATAMMEKLSELMRFGLHENTAQEIPLDKEISLLTLYIDIQKIRFEDKMHVFTDIPETLRKALVPSMILQPVVENAIRYAVEASAGPTAIFIGASKEGSQLALVVRDENRGEMNEFTIKKGIGLSNIEERLEKLYKDKQRLEIRHHSRPGYKGLEISISIPLHYE